MIVDTEVPEPRATGMCSAVLGVPSRTPLRKAARNVRNLVVQGVQGKAWCFPVLGESVRQQ